MRLLFYQQYKRNQLPPTRHSQLHFSAATRPWLQHQRPPHRPPRWASRPARPAGSGSSARQDSSQDIFILWGLEVFYKHFASRPQQRDSTAGHISTCGSVGVLGRSPQPRIPHSAMLPVRPGGGRRARRCLQGSRALELWEPH